MLGALALAVGVAVLDRYHVGVFHDDAMYVILGRALATGQGYRYLNLPGAPVASHFPPGYPALLSLVWRVAPSFPANLVVFKLLNAVFFCASAVLVALLVRDRLESRAWAIGTGVVTAVSVPLLVLVTMVLSEPLFLAVLLAALILAERLVKGAVSTRLAGGLGLLGCDDAGAIAWHRAPPRDRAAASARSAGGATRRSSRLARSSCSLPWQLWSARARGRAAGAAPGQLRLVRRLVDARLSRNGSVDDSGDSPAHGA